MKRLIEFFVRHEIWANAIIALTVIGGIIGFLQIKRSFFPERPTKVIAVRVAMPGASPIEMEEGVTIRIEEAIKGIEGIDETSSTSGEDIANIQITIENDADLDEVLTDVKNSIDRINSFPENAEKPVIYKEKPLDRAAMLAITGDVDLLTLKRAAEEVEDDFLASGLISQIVLTGFPELEISIEVREEDLLRYNLLFSDIVNAVRENNRDIAAGSIKGEDEEILIRSRAKSVESEDIGAIILRASPDGSKLRIRDVAVSIKRRFADRPERNFYNGKPSISIEVKKLPEEDLVAISDFLHQYVEDANRHNPAVQVVLTYDFFSMLKQRIDMLSKNGLIGFAMVLITLGAFLSLRLSFWVAWGIPASFLGMFIVGSFTGLTINLISLFGMILVVGILVDDGIVVAENIFTHFEEGKTPFRAAVDGTMEVLPAVFTSVTTTIIAFTPLFFLDGFDFVREIALVVVASLAFSLIEAAFVLPAHLSSKSSLKVTGRDTILGRMRTKTEGFINYLKHGMYETALRWAMRNKAVTMGLVVLFGCVVIGMLGGGIIGATFFPSIPFDDITIEVAFKPGEREDQTERYLREFEKAAWQVGNEIYNEIGDSVIKQVSFSIGAAGRLNESGSHAGNVYISLDVENKPISSFAIVDRLRAKIGQVPEAEKLSVGGFNRWGAPVSISLLGKDIDELYAARDYVFEKLQEYPALKEVKDNNAAGKRELQIELKDKAFFLGLTHAEITRQIRQGFFGEEAQRLQIGTDEVRVWVRYAESDRLSIGRLEAIKIKTAGGEEYPLAELVDYTIARGIVDIKHFNGLREIKVEASLSDPYAPVLPITQQVWGDITPELDARFPGVAYEKGGQERRTAETRGSAFVVIPIMLLLILLVITLNFRSLFQAMLVIGLLPIGILCAILGHWVQGLPVSILSMYGMLALAGVIVNDAVVLLDKYNRLIREGKPYVQAAISAGLARFRPIVLTTLTTVSGLFPLIVLEKSFQAQFIIPMAVSVAYGVLFGTAYILIVFPVIIVLANEFKALVFWILSGGQKQINEQLEPALLERARQMEMEEK